MRLPLGISVAFVFLVLLCGGVTGATGGDAIAEAETETLEPGESAAAAAAPGTPTIELHQELRRTPEQAGEYDVEHRYRIPDAVTRLEVVLPAEATVTSTTGFVKRDDAYVWDGSTADPTVTYSMEANRTAEEEGPIAGPGRYKFVDRGEWSLVTRPRASHRWGWGGDDRIDFERTASVRGPGAASDVIAFLGPHEEYRHTAHGQTFRLVVPDAANLEESPEEIFASLEHASDVLRVGERDREVFLVAAPTGDVRWAVRGLQTGPADMWVRDIERLDDVDNVWLHEYVHARQGYTAADDVRWFTEGAAVYYAALLTLEQERIDFETFQRRLARGENDRFDGVRLAERNTWRHNADYHVGALVAGELDRRIRLASEFERSLQLVWSRMNEAPDPVDRQQFETLLAVAGDSDVAADGDRYTTTAQRPSMWTETAHGEAFGVVPARISYRLPEPGAEDAYRVSGAYRNRSLDATEPLVLVPTETLAVEAVVRNDGETAGSYDAVFRVSGERWGASGGRLEPGGTATVSFSHRFTEVGEHTVAVGGVSVPVSVRPPAEARVTGFEADRETVEAGGTVTLSITVENDASVPGEIEFPITRNGVEVDRKTVRVDAESTRTVTTERTLESPRSYVFGLGTASPERVTVTVPEPQSGFGIAPALAAVVALSTLAVRLRGRGR